MKGSPESIAATHNGAIARTIVEEPIKSKPGPTLFLLGYLRTILKCPRASLRLLARNRFCPISATWLTIASGA